MPFDFNQAVEYGMQLTDQIHETLNTQYRFASNNWSFVKNDNLETDLTDGDIFAYSSTGLRFACIDAKNSNMICLKSIANFNGFNNGKIQRAYFMTRTSIINNTSVFKTWVFEQIYNMFPEQNMRQLGFNELVIYLNLAQKINACNIPQLSPIFGLMSRSKELGLYVDQIPMHLKIYDGDIKHDKYWLSLYKDMKFKA